MKLLLGMIEEIDIEIVFHQAAFGMMVLIDFLDQRTTGTKQVACANPVISDCTFSASPMLAAQKGFVHFPAGFLLPNSQTGILIFYESIAIIT